MLPCGTVFRSLVGLCFGRLGFGCLWDSPAPLWDSDSHACSHAGLCFGRLWDCVSVDSDSVACGTRLPPCGTRTLMHAGLCDCGARSGTRIRSLVGLARPLWESDSPTLHCLHHSRALLTRLADDDSERCRGRSMMTRRGVNRDLPSPLPPYFRSGQVGLPAARAAGGGVGGGAQPRLGSGRPPGV